MKDKMIEWYKKGIAVGASACMFNMGYSYEYGDGVERDDVAAYNYYMMAKKAGYGQKADKALAKFKKALFGKIKKR